MHPPHLSAYIDKDGDGVADEEKVLVKNIAFGFKDRPADHTSNGVTLGIDGWLYLAIGDFGFLKAEGTDGKTLQLRGGGVVRVRPDGTGLEVYSRGTRNILEVAIDPLLNGFARDNTNDGGGWDIRLHHFTGLEDHGYPSLFKNFTDEIVAAPGRLRRRLRLRRPLSRRARLSRRLRRRPLHRRLGPRPRLPPQAHARRAPPSRPTRPSS